MTLLESPALFTSSTAATVGNGGPPLTNKRRVIRFGVVAAVACALLLAGCGGGELSADVAVVQPVGFHVGVLAGQTTYAPALPGQVLEVVGRIGQSLVFDASEPVTWSFSVNGSPLFAGGTIVDLGGITLTQSQVSVFRVVLDSEFYGPALVPVQVLLTATSTFDQAQVATIRLILE